ncbi:DNA-processing protein DprA [Pseudomonas fluorescens]|uniref:Smf/DprA SLOG domain-containing protein n=1 Tax=Pseudomonas fluorescens TaxID=294 RepID=A0A5E7CZK0_PSEFL|nr:DNA-processing protein DprA [Pseudomonas fluorescens]VVO10116.1 hypothetical protein PS691_03331 [Pseudomonas fluorescens]
MYLEEIDDQSRRVAWIHAVLVLSKKIAIGSAKANDDLRKKILSAGSVENLYKDFFSLIPVDDEVAKKVTSKLNKYTHCFRAVTCVDDDYPSRLNEFPGTPPIIYTQGDLSLLQTGKSIAVVGTRHLDEVAHVEHGRRVVKRLISSGYRTIVSGLASGSDTLGHSSAIQYGGRTIAVLGTPIDTFYPRENSALQSEIARDNLVVSEYPIGVGSFGSYFANRNRTTVALSSDGVVVIRAGDKSGTQYAIRICMEQGKQLYVLENNLKEADYTWVSKYKNKIKLVREDFDAGDNI